MTPMTWLLLIAIAWVALALPIGLLVASGMRLADQRDQVSRLRTTVPDYIPADVIASVAAQHRPT
jgi:hypothetical protein